MHIPKAIAISPISLLTDPILTPERTSLVQPSMVVALVAVSTFLPTKPAIFLLQEPARVLLDYQSTCMSYLAPWSSTLPAHWKSACRITHPRCTLSYICTYLFCLWIFFHSWLILRDKNHTLPQTADVRHTVYSFLTDLIISSICKYRWLYQVRRDQKYGADPNIILTAKQLATSNILLWMLSSLLLLLFLFLSLSAKIHIYSMVWFLPLRRVMLQIDCSSGSDCRSGRIYICGLSAID